MDSKPAGTVPKLNGEAPKSTTLMFSIKDQVGGLAAVLTIFKEYKVNVHHIESRKSRKRPGEYEIIVDLEASNEKKENIISRIKEHVTFVKLHALPKQTLEKLGRDTSMDIDGVPWFPRKVNDLDISSNRVLMFGAELGTDHPGYNDTVYRERRLKFADIAYNYKHGQPIPKVEYSAEECKTWGTVYKALTAMYPKYACKEYLQNFPLLEEHCGYCPERLPQLEDISRFLQQKTGFTLRPVAGYLSSRDFLAGLAFRVFHCTQYIRHGADPFYSPEPDCCHELLGHMPLFLNQSFAEFSQEIGLASLGASDEEVQKLATCYFFTVEFGLCTQDGGLRVYGAGLLSSVGELKHALSDKAVIKPFEPENTVEATCQVTTFQDQYFYSSSFEEAKDKLRQYAKTIKRPFELRYNAHTRGVDILDTPTSIATYVESVKDELDVITHALSKLKARSKFNHVHDILQQPIPE